MIVFALAASPSLVLNSIQFHSPFKQGTIFGSFALAGGCKGPQSSLPGTSQAVLSFYGEN